MNMMLQNSIFYLSTMQQEASDTSSSSIVDLINELSETLQNLWWLIVVVFSVLCLLFALLLFCRKTNKYTKTQIDKLIESQKYIPGIFVELNDSKEVLRYFVFGRKRKWKIRLIKNFNLVYENAYGDILRKALYDPCICFRLTKTASFERIEEAVNVAANLHKELSEDRIEFRPDYKQSKYLFEIIRYPYSKTLETLQQYIKATNSRYLILTGSAGNGKTNLLCSICELLLNANEAVVFLNARDIDNDVLEYLYSELKLPDIFKKHADVYLFIVNFLLTIRRKHLFIIIDAINENNNVEFANRIAEFINKILKYSRIKVIVSCRNEYYQERFREPLVEKVTTNAYEFDLKEQSYNSIALDRIIKVYRNHFTYSGFISPAVVNVLSKQLLLLRIFFEVNKNSDVDVYSIRKHEIFSQYIETIKKNKNEKVEHLLDNLTDVMLTSANYDQINLLVLEERGLDSDIIEKSVDNSIIVSKKLVSHDGTIAKKEIEVIYFVFDEMRDYYLAKRILQKNSSHNNVDGDAILEKIRQLKESGASCAEGIIHYTYIFFRTDTIIAQLNRTEKLCNSVLDIYRIQEHHDSPIFWGSPNRNEFQNLGLRIILTSGLPITDFETAYIQDCLRKDSYEDSGILFDTMLDGTLYEGINDLDTYLDILLGLKDKDSIKIALQQVVSHSFIPDGNYPEYFIAKHKELIDTAPVKAIQIQKVVELFLLFYEFNKTDSQKLFVDYFYALPTHEEVQQEMFFRFNRACDFEEKDNE